MTGPLGLLYPVLAQVLWTFILYVLTARARISAIRSRRVRVADIALAGEAWPDEAKKVANNLHNQFETPVIFYVLCGAASYIGETGVLMVLLAWLYVATRVVHTAIHVTTNRVRHRFQVFTLGLAILALMWLAIVFRLLAS
jgi:hypothetical protein